MWFIEVLKLYPVGYSVRQYYKSIKMVINVGNFTFFVGGGVTKIALYKRRIRPIQKILVQLVIHMLRSYLCKF
jgi:hypothetical protein